VTVSNGKYLPAFHRILPLSARSKNPKRHISYTVVLPCFPRAAEITEPGLGVPPITGPAQPPKQNGMGNKDWQPFVYGGLASCTAEFGMSDFHTHFLCSYFCSLIRDHDLFVRVIILKVQWMTLA
jgi:hypothetical protein